MAKHEGSGFFGHIKSSDDDQDEGGKAFGFVKAADHAHHEGGKVAGLEVVTDAAGPIRIVYGAAGSSERRKKPSGPILRGASKRWGGGIPVESVVIGPGPAVPVVTESVRNVKRKRLPMDAETRAGFEQLQRELD